MKVYHGTNSDLAYNNLLHSSISNSEGLWVANSPEIAKTYGNFILEIIINENADYIELYPLSTGKLTQIENVDTKEPMEIYIKPYSKLLKTESYIECMFL